MNLAPIEAFLGELTASDWVKIAVAAPEIVTALIKVGQAAGPVFTLVEKRITTMAQANHPATPLAREALASLSDAWTAVDQRIYDQQNGSRG